MKYKAKCVAFLSILLLCLHDVHSAGEGAKYNTTSQDVPIFVPLQEGQGKYDACLQDGENECNLVTSVSFAGGTKIAGIRSELNDSFSTLDLATLKKIEVVDPFYPSTRYPDQEFICVNITTLGGAVEQLLLVPRNVIICGVDKKTHQEKAWFLRALTQVTLSKADDINILQEQLAHAPPRRHIRSRPKKKGSSQPTPTLPTQERSTPKQPLPAPAALTNTVPQETPPLRTVHEWPAPATDSNILTHEKTLGDSFLAVIDSVIDLIKTIVSRIWNIIKW